jgi:hypothetical protein
MAKSEKTANKKTTENRETVALLKEISGKLTVLNDKKEDRLFQLKMLDLQIRQNNVVVLITVVVSIGISFLVTYLSITLSGVIPSSQINALFQVIVLMLIVFVIAFIIFWTLLHNEMIRKLNKLRDKVTES